MIITRRDCLSLALISLAGPARAIARQSSDRSALQSRIARLVREFEQQGHHRTGTAVDAGSAEWLAAQVGLAGLRPAVEPFSLSRVDAIAVAVIAADRRFEGIPLFDGAFTGAAGSADA